MTFATNLAKEYGFRMDEKLLANSSEYLRDSLVMSTLGKKEYLYKIFKDSMERGKTLPFDNEFDQLKYEKIQEIRSSAQTPEKTTHKASSKGIYNAYAKDILLQDGSIWRGRTDVEIYKAMLKQGLEETKIKDMIRRNSPALIGKEKILTAKYVNEIGNQEEITLLKNKIQKRSMKR